MAKYGRKTQEKVEKAMHERFDEVGPESCIPA